MKRILEALAVVCVLATPLAAYAAKVTVNDPWIRALPGNAAGYFSLKNDENNPIVLTGAESTACGMIMLHKSNRDGGMASMTDMAEVKLAPHEIVKFEPGSFHLMCMDPKPVIKPGARVMITLMFGNGSTNPVSFAVRNAAGH